MITTELLNEVEHGGLTDAETQMLYNHLRKLAKANDKRIIRAELGRGYSGIFHNKILSVGTYGNGGKFQATCRPVTVFADLPPVSERWTATIETAIPFKGEPVQNDAPETVVEDYGLMGTR